jgi:dTDP-4-amino-4,6-dideoxy-D-galactose acyltransferase
MYTHLDWDSNFFGFPTARIDSDNMNPETLEEALDHLKLKTYKLIYLFTDPSDKEISESAKRLGGKLVDEKVTFGLKISEINTNSQHDTNIVSYPIKEPTIELIQLAIESGKYSRFKIDNGFSEGIFEKLYTQWITNSTLRLNADEVFVYTTGNKIRGMITFIEKEKIGSIGLIAVAPDTQGMGIGRKLVNKVIHQCYLKDINNLEVVTQSANKGASDFYKKIGFKILSIKNIYHFWIK